MKVGIIQPNYIPWRGHFDFIRQVDTFIFYDDVQYTKRDWRNRNKVRMLSGESIWITVPVNARRDTLIMDALIDNSEDWQQKHLSVLKHNYGKTPFFGDYIGPLEATLRGDHKSISDLDVALCEQICPWLEIEAKTLRASTLQCTGSKDQRLIDLVKKIGGTSYLSGPAAKSYIQPDLWQEAGIELEFMTYPDYPEYEQIAPGFEPAVSILDLLFMVGPDAPRYIWGD